MTQSKNMTSTKDVNKKQSDLRSFLTVLFVAASLTVGSAFSSQQAIAQGQGNNECGTGIKDESAPWEYTTPDGSAITTVYVKAGSANQTPDPDGSNFCTTMKTDGTDPSGCYSVTGLGTSHVVVTGGGTGRDCKDISHVTFGVDALPSPSASPEATPSATPTATPSATPEATATPVPTPTPEATATPTPTPVATATPAPTSTPSNESNNSNNDSGIGGGEVLGASTEVTDPAPKPQGQVLGYATTGTSADMLFGGIAAIGFVLTAAGSQYAKKNK